MALPVGVETCTITFGSDVDFAGGPVSVSIVATPTHDLVWKTTGQRVLAFPISANAAEGVPGSISLPVVDQDGFADGEGNDFTMWAYTLKVTYTGAGGKETVTKAVQPLSGQSSLDFDLLPTGQITSGVSATIPAVLSVNGDTGNVTVDVAGAVASVNSHTGTVVLAATDVGADAAGAAAAAQAAAVQRANHTGTQSADTITDGTTNKAYTAVEKTKLAGVASGATANAGTVTTASVVTANGVSGSVATAASTPAITLTLGAITPSSVAATGAVSGSNLSGTNTGDQTSVTGNAGTATKLATPQAIDGQNFDGSAPVTVIAPGTHAATGKTTPVDADEVPIVDSAASNVLKKLTWANLKAAILAFIQPQFDLRPVFVRWDGTGGTPARPVTSANVICMWFSPVQPTGGGTVGGGAGAVDNLDVWEVTAS